MQLFEKIGRQLDRNIYPVVKNGGLVIPNHEPSNEQQNSYSGEKDEQQAQKQFEFRTRQRQIVQGRAQRELKTTCLCGIS